MGRITSGQILAKFRQIPPLAIPTPHFLKSDMSQILTVPKINGLDRPEPSENSHITNNGFFPNISLAELRNAMRIDGTVTHERLRLATIEAINTVNRDLKNYRQTAQQQGINTLADSDDEQIGGESSLVLLYQRAVYCLATANLQERYRSFDSTREGHNKADELLDTAGDLRRDYHFAVRDILGEHRMIADLV